MGRYVIKAAPDRDAYFWWSTIVDAPVFLGDRAEMLRELDRPRRGEEWPREGVVEADLARADATGTSVRYGVGGPLDGAWDDRWIRLMEGVTKSGWIARDRLGEFYDRVEAAGTIASVLTDDLVLSYEEWEEAGHNVR